MFVIDTVWTHAVAQARLLMDDVLSDDTDAVIILKFAEEIECIDEFVIQKNF